MNGTILPDGVVYVMWVHWYSGEYEVINFFRTEPAAIDAVKKFKTEHEGSFYSVGYDARKVQ